MVTLTYPLASDPLSHSLDQQATWGQSGVEVSKLAGYVVCDGNMSSNPTGAAAGSCILLVSVHLVKNLLLSRNTSFSHTFLHLILTKLCQSDRYLNHYLCTNDDGVRSHDGISGVKKIIFTKKASTPTDDIALTRDLLLGISLIPSTKVTFLKINPWSFGVAGVKRSFALKTL